MRIAKLLLVLSCWFWQPAAIALAQFDRDERNQKDVQFSLDDPWGQKKEQEAWKKWIQALGKGPVYQVEILLRYDNAKPIYYLRTLVSSKKPHGGKMAGFGFDERGNPLGPPNPGYVRLEQMRLDSRIGIDKPPPPLAQDTRYLGVSMRPEDSVRGSLSVSCSDIGTDMPLPKKPGAAEVYFFGDSFTRVALFRVEWLTEEKLAKAEPLRQDPDFYRRRLAELRQEMFTKFRDTLLHNQNLDEAALLFLEPFLLEEIRRRLAHWIDNGPFKEDSRGVPHAWTRTLELLGEPKDFGLFLRFVERHPQRAHFLVDEALSMTRRLGAKEAMPVLTKLLHDPEPWSHAPLLDQLMKLEPTVPPRTAGDRAVSALARVFKLYPVDLNMRLAESRLLELSSKHPLDAKLKEEVERALRNPTEGYWIFLSDADRRRGIAKALEQMRAYQPD
ncbi:MAG: hypothetical protein L0Y70_25080 [Gemmataceae bacterium]|nr:hypothetical protein [Gemmataceae bacterium]